MTGPDSLFKVNDLLSIQMSIFPTQTHLLRKLWGNPAPEEGIESRTEGSKKGTFYIENVFIAAI